MKESKSMFMAVILHLTHAGKYYFVLHQFILYKLLDCKYEKPMAVWSVNPCHFLKNLIKNVDYNFSKTGELPALFSRDQKILSTCNGWKILTSDQLAFINLLLEFWQSHSVIYVRQELANCIQRS